MASPPGWPGRWQASSAGDPSSAYASIVDAAAQDIANLIYTYAELIDTGDFAGVGALLEQATVTFEGHDLVLTGADAIEALYVASTRRYEDGTPRTKHVMTNVIVEVDGTRASSRSYFTVLQAVPGSVALQPVVAGRYRDRFEFRGSAWVFTGMHVIIDLMGDVSGHLLIDV